MIGRARLGAGLYNLDFSSEKNIALFTQTDEPFQHVKNLDTWHCRLGHPSSKVLECMSKTYPYICFDKNNMCTPCHLVKQHKLPFPLSKSTCDNSFDLVHIDIWGPFSIPSIHGHKYFLTVVDDYTRFTWVYLMKNKNETRSLLTNFVVMVKNQFDKGIKIIRTDNGQEFCCKDFYDKYDIIHQTTCVETPQQNYMVECKHQHILNVTRCLMFQSNLPKIFWSYAIMHVVHLINRVPSPVISNKCPYEKLYTIAPDISV